MRGSSNFWLPSERCQGSACERHRRLATPPVTEDRPGLATSFASGQLVGFAVNESLCLGGLCAELTVMAALQESDYPFSAMPFDGILGPAPRQGAFGRPSQGSNRRWRAGRSCKSICWPFRRPT